MKTGDKALIDPKVTGLNVWIEGIIIKIRNNPFLGKEIAIKDNKGNIYFEAAKYFKIVTKIMFAISFDMLIAELKTNYGETYNNAYYEISVVLEEFHFYRAQGSVYLSEKNDMANLTKAMIKLKSIDWFKKSVRDIRAFKIEDWSNFTDFMKEE